MDEIRKVREPTQAAGSAVKPGFRNCVSKPSLKRVLSMQAVLDDMHTILWPDGCDQQRGEIDLVSEDRVQS